MKPSDTRWLSHEHCVKAIHKELPPLLQTLSQLYESSGDAEADGIYVLLASVNGVSSSYPLSEVFSALALLNVFMQKKIADFSKLPFVLKSTLDHLIPSKGGGGGGGDASWCTAAETAISNLETEHGITIKASRVTSPPLVQQFRVQVAIPYLDKLIANINSRFSGEVVELLVAASVFKSARLPDDETLPRAYGNSKLSTLVNFYGEKAEVTFEGVRYSSLAIINKEELLGEMQVFKRTVFQEMVMMEKTPALHL